MKKALLIFGIAFCVIGLMLEACFFINVVDILKDQSQVFGFVQQLEANHGDSVCVWSVSHDRLIIKISSDTTIKEMEDIVNEYETGSSDPQYITKIIFVDENATDMVTGVASDCMIVFAKSGENTGFDTIDINCLNPELFPQLADFSYQELSGSYRFNVNVPITIDQTDERSNEND